MCQLESVDVQISKKASKYRGGFFGVDPVPERGFDALGRCFGGTHGRVEEGKLYRKSVAETAAVMY